MDLLSNMVANLNTRSLVFVRQVPYTRLNVSVLSVIRELGFINSFKVQEKKIAVVMSQQLKINRVSTSGKRVYISYKYLRRFSKKGFLVLSTSRGIITHVEACALRIGGEILIYIEI